MLCKLFTKKPESATGDNFSLDVIVCVAMMIYIVLVTLGTKYLVNNFILELFGIHDLVHQMRYGFPLGIIIILIAMLLPFKWFFKIMLR
jgi:hypothetical protein